MKPVAAQRASTKHKDVYQAVPSKKTYNSYTQDLCLARYCLVRNKLREHSAAFGAFEQHFTENVVNAQ